MGRECSTYEGDVKCMQNVGWKPESKKPLRRSRQKWVCYQNTDAQLQHCELLSLGHIVTFVISF